MDVFITVGVMPHLPLPQASSLSQSDNFTCCAFVIAVV